MKLLLLLLVTTCSAAILQVPTTSLGSLRQKMIQEGTYSSFLASGSQPLLDLTDDLCIGNISIGDPPQQLSVFMDTTSANLWVVDAACQSGFVKTKFNTTISYSFVKRTRKFSIPYGSGNCSGYLGVDNVRIGGLTIRKQTFGVANIVADEFGIQPIDGVLGLAWPARSVGQVTTPMQNLISQKQLDAPMFTIWQGGASGLITFGGIDTLHCDADVTYVPVSSEAYWQFKIDAFGFGYYLRIVKEQAIANTGSSWFGMMHFIFYYIVTSMDAIKINDVYTVPCSTRDSHPDLDFFIGGKHFPIKPADYIVDVGLGDGRCVLAIYEIGSSGFGSDFVFGNIFFRRYCSVYDFGNARIGFAKSRPTV